MKRKTLLLLTVPFALSSFSALASASPAEGEFSVLSDRQTGTGKW